MTDPIADMLTRIRNAYMANKKQVSIPYSGIKHQIAKKLQQLNYIQEVSEGTDQGFKSLNLKLSYIDDQPCLTKIIRVSKPGRKVYIRKNHIEPTLSGYGSTIISTSKGLMTDKEAQSAGLGGEVICQIW